MQRKIVSLHEVNLGVSSLAAVGLNLRLYTCVCSKLTSRPMRDAELKQSALRKCVYSNLSAVVHGSVLVKRLRVF